MVEADTASEVNRRGALKAISGATTASVLVGNALAHDGRHRTIVVGEYKNEPIVTRKVPEEWYEHVQRSRRAQDELSERFSDESWFDQIGRTSRDGNYRIGDLKEMKLRVRATDRDGAEREVPDRQNDIPVEIVETSGSPEFQCTDWDKCDDDNYSCMKGGSFIHLEQDDGSFCQQSACIVVEDERGETGVMTAFHGFDKSDEYQDIKLREGKQGTDESKIGHVRDYSIYDDESSYDESQDWAILYLYEEDIDGFINDIIKESYPIEGHLTKSGLESIASDDGSRPVENYGASTCHTQGYDLELLNRVNTNCDEKEEGFEVLDGYTEQGDSGSPHYVAYDNFEIALMAGIHVRGGPRGVAACAINNKHSIEFGKISNC